MKILKLDSRKRISLGALAKEDFYIASTDEDGIITLSPLSPISKIEFRSGREGNDGLTDAEREGFASRYRLSAGSPLTEEEVRAGTEMMKRMIPFAVQVPKEGS